MAADRIRISITCYRHTLPAEVGVPTRSGRFGFAAPIRPPPGPTTRLPENAMSLPDPFADLPVVGKLNQDDAAARLAEVGEADGGSQDPALPVPFGSLDFLPWRRKLWAGTTHLFGYLPPARSGSDLVPVVHPGTIAADTTLAGTRVRVTLERLRVAQYPGCGPHTVLIDFAARNSA